MRKFVSSLALVASLAPLAEAPGQAFVGVGFSRGRVRVSFGAALYGFGPRPLPCWGGPYFPPWCAPPLRVAFVPVATPVFLPLPSPPPPPPDDPPPMVVIPPAPGDEPPPKRERGVEVPRPPAARGDAAEAGFQARLGRESFQLGDYGLAARRFREAASLKPDDTEARFLLAQSLLALGKYHEARDAILAGLGLRPDWPTSGFRPIEMYDDVGEYADHLATLAAVVARHPRDAELAFVSGYALWFDGRRAEAADAFRRSADAGAAELFLATLPPGETL